MPQPSPYQRVTTQHDVTEAGVASVGYLYFDGAGDFMFTSTITPATDKAQTFAGVRKLSDAAACSVVDFGQTLAGSFNLLAPGATGTSSLAGKYFAASSGSFRVTVAPTGFVAPTTNVLSAVGDISGDTLTLRVDGTQAAQSTSDQGTGNYLAYPLYIGSRGGSSLFFTGHLYSLITRFGPTLDAPTIASTEVWVAGKTGITI